jgi:hypothetical protein
LARWVSPKAKQVQIASHCQQRALLFLQIAKECPEFRDQAFYMAREWLDIAAVRIMCLAQIDGIEKEDRADRSPQSAEYWPVSELRGWF